MATNANHPLAVALDQRIRAVVNEAVAEALREQVGQILNEQLATLIGGKAAPAAAKPAAKRGPGRPRKTESAARAARASTAGKAAAKRGPGRPRKSEAAAPRAGTKASASAAAAGEQKCEVVGCKRPYRSRGYCAAHYQAARKYGWPMPATKNFEPPARPSRGRPAANA